jgi:hypothetical protein
MPENFVKWAAKNEEKAASLGIPAFKQPSVKSIKPVSTPHKGFSIYKEYSNGGRIEIMDGYVKKSDHKDLHTIAREWAKEGKVVQMTTDVHYKSDMYGQVFGTLRGTKYERKCPDLIVNSKFYEYESYVPPFNKRKISHMIKKGTVQSSRIIINNNKGASDRYIIRNIIERRRDRNFKYDINEVWLYEKGKIRKLKWNF